MRVELEGNDCVRLTRRSSVRQWAEFHQLGYDIISCERDGSPWKRDTHSPCYTDWEYSIVSAMKQGVLLSHLLAMEVEYAD